MIGDIIKALRKENNLSQKALAEQIGVSQKAIDYWERGINEPKASYIIKLADFFQCSIDFLVGRQEEFLYISPPSALSKQDQQLLSNFRKLTKENKNIVQIITKALLNK